MDVFWVYIASTPELQRGIGADSENHNQFLNIPLDQEWSQIVNFVENGDFFKGK